MLTASRTEPIPHQTDPLVRRTLALVDAVFGAVVPANFGVRLWQGSTWGPADDEAAFTLVLRHPGALRRLLSSRTEGDLAACYISGDVGVEGDLEAVVPMSRALLARRRSKVERLRLGLQLLRLPHGPAPGIAPPHLRGRQHSAGRDRLAVTHHYDVSNAFYRLWLDERMVYSCACFTEDDDDLDRAQLRKLDLLCRKLRLQPGQRLLDIGCGWGGLLLHACQEHGVEGLGITLSAPQAAEANARFAAAGLAGRCRAEVVDYRDLRDPAGFDRIVSVGMVEHVGSERLDDYFAAAWDLLRPGGAFLLHGIGDLPGRPQRAGRGFVGTYVFPDSDLPPIARVLSRAEAHDFEVRDVESLRENYTLTLRHWSHRLRAREREAVQEVGAETYRAWLLYMAGCAWWFERGYISVYQSLLVKRTDSGASGLPLSRFDWYEAPSDLGSLSRRRRRASTG